MGRVADQIAAISDPGIRALAEWMHEKGLGCRYEYRDPADIGIGRVHKGDHEAEAHRFLDVLKAAGVPTERQEERE